MKNEKTFWLLALAFIIWQPVIDVLTSASLLLLNISLTVGVIVRVLFMAAIVLMLLWKARQSGLARKYILYLLAVAAVIAINIVLNMNVKDPYYLGSELKFFNKIVYFPILFTGFSVLYLYLKREQVPFKEKTTSYFLYASLIISAVFLVSFVTGTSLSNYSHTKIGFSGWFYAGNEIGAIMAIILPVTALYAIEKTNRVKEWRYWIPFVLLAVSMQFLGTKVGYGGIVVVLLAAFFSMLILYFTKERSEKTRSNMLISLVLIAVLAVTTPVTPVFHNMFAHLSLLNIDFSKEKEKEIDPDTGEELPEDEQEEEEPEITNEQVQNLVFSSREKYLAEMKDQFAEAPVSQKLFGMGFAGNYEEPEPGKTPRMIEMDFFDLFFSLGIVGFLTMMSLPLYYAIRFVIHFVRNIKQTFTPVNIMYGVAFILGIGISATAGHVLTAPAVSIYVAAVMALLMVQEGIIKE
ncbi:O-antigen ligase family protein [Domibacillus sp. DTU_2020_1001157_1_SI_ALB_TIR_016]|uniref:O-antigen ligase family protein n=1 Tax=Domibacillus sp. DTU_2020_1001157_1_SI_ALB_TIR_016 TaxID=3077789 RepID=UPI0028E9DDEA|nr:O-antigen ligase family protein [Domibacillus sp. DTU_2020_1001157_1_SI_ALB_TIR_016]WNS81245.1 O-antigen ligase family protein [Domibacillus sp. DTU_2020_1001157_1_SI_ALB_TIR_016]